MSMKPEIGRWAAVGATALVFLAGCGLPRLWEPTPRASLERILPSAVQVVVEQREGRRVRAASGVVMGTRSTPAGPECLVLTSGHAVTDTPGRLAIHVVFGRHAGPGRKARATVLASRETGELDVAVLAAGTSACVPARPGLPPALGEPVWVVAFPLGRTLTLAYGIVSQVYLDGEQDGERSARLMIDALVGYGASGGGVFEARTGRLIGIVEGYRTARVAAQGGGAGGWYVDVPLPGHTLVTPLAEVGGFLGQVGLGQVLDAR